MKQIDVEVSTTIILKYDPESKEFKDALESYRDATDMVCPVDAALSEVAFDLIYERKNEYDFEEEQV